MTELEQWMKEHVRWEPRAYYIDPSLVSLLEKNFDSSDSGPENKILEKRVCPGGAFLLFVNARTNPPHPHRILLGDCCTFRQSSLVHPL